MKKPYNEEMNLTVENGLKFMSVIEHQSYFFSLSLTS